MFVVRIDNIAVGTVVDNILGIVVGTLGIVVGIVVGTLGIVVGIAVGNSFDNFDNSVVHFVGNIDGIVDAGTRKVANDVFEVVVGIDAIVDVE